MMLFKIFRARKLDARYRFIRGAIIENERELAESLEWILKGNYSAEAAAFVKLSKQEQKLLRLKCELTRRKMQKNVRALQREQVTFW